MKDWFLGLEARERLVVVAGAIIASIVIIYGLIWVPLDKAHQNAREDVQDWSIALAELRQKSALASSADNATQNAVRSDDSPVVIVDRTLRAMQVTAKRQQPTPNGVRVEFEDVAFDTLVLWLGTLHSQHAMEVQAGSFSRSSRSEPGRINASLTLERTL